MRKKLFGEYLIERKIVTEESLLDALMEQMNRIPSVCQIAHQLKLFSPSELLRVIKHQMTHGEDFKSACISLELWNSSVNQAIQSELQRVRVPIGEILIKSGKVDISTLTKALDEFLVEVSTDEATHVESEKDLLSNPSTQEAVQYSVIDPEMLKNYTDLFSLRKYSELGLMIQSIQELIRRNESSSKIECQIQNALKEIVSLQGAARFVETKQSEKLVSESGKALKAALKDLTRMTPDEIDRLNHLQKQALDLVWGIRTTLQQTGSEKDFFEQKTQSDSYESTYRELRKFLNERVSP